MEPGNTLMWLRKSSIFDDQGLTESQFLFSRGTKDVEGGADYLPAGEGRDDPYLSGPDKGGGCGEGMLESSSTWALQTEKIARYVWKTC